MGLNPELGLELMIHLGHFPWNKEDNLEEVRKEELKLLEEGLIYPISDSS